MVDGAEQSTLIAKLRLLAEKQAAKDPTFASLRLVGKTLIDEIRKLVDQGETNVTLGAFISRDNEVKFVRPVARNQNAQSEIVTTLRRLSVAGQILGGACGSILQRPLVPNGPNVPFIEAHIELVNGMAIRSAVPVDIPLLEKGIPGKSGVTLSVYARKVEPRIFLQTPSI
jgi:hypothetical protein